jgi:hypothetical protein
MVTTMEAGMLYYVESDDTWMYSFDGVEWEVYESFDQALRATSADEIMTIWEVA